MRTVIIILGGFLLLGICLLLARSLNAGTNATVLAVKVFIPLWLAAAASNMWVGVSRAGYAVSEELPIFLVIFLIPAALALWLWWKSA